MTSKRTQASVRYSGSGGAPNRRCGVCLNHRVPRSCLVVEGDISPDGICDQFDVTSCTVGNGG